MEILNNNDKYLNKLHRDIIMIMDEVDRICRENNIHYYLMCGSCLGAIRHNGFIPWDDDLDVAMPRKDFNRFIELVSNINKPSLLKEEFYLRWITTEKNYNYAFAKVCMKGTVFQQDNNIPNYNSGIFVDVFPLDNCKHYSKKIEFKNLVVKFLNRSFHYRGMEGRVFDWNLKRFIHKLISRLFSGRFIHNLMLYIIGTVDDKESDYQVFFNTPYPIKRMIFPKTWHGEGKRLPFEDRMYVCPDEAELYLERIYGNFMSIPPESKRKTHYPVRVVFSDGDEMFFEKTKKKVKYSDLLE